MKSFWRTYGPLVILSGIICLGMVLLYSLASAATSVLPVFSGGTGTSTFSQGWVNSSGGTNTFTASTSPTVNYLTSTSTTATSTFAAGIAATYLNLTGTSASSTFANGIQLSKGCFSMANGTCIAAGGSGTVTSVAASNGITGGTITTSGTLSLVSYISTSTADTRGQLAYWSTTNGTPAQLASVSTTSGTCGSGITCTAFPVIGSTNPSWALTAINANSVLANQTNASAVPSQLATSSLGVALSDTTGTLTIARGGTATTTGGNTNGVEYYDGSKLTNSSLLYWNGTTLGLASSTPSTLAGISVGTSTVVEQAQLAVNISSSTTDNTTETVNWDKGNEVRYVLNQNTNIAINATSSYPRDGGKYILKLCQDGTGSRTVTFVTPAQLVWEAGATTSVQGTANTETILAMVYDGRTQRYDIVASSTPTDTRACVP
jgi:hypothetical protein